MSEKKGPNRELILSETINTSSASSIITKIREINQYDAKEEEKLKEFTREPIVLMVNCFGGDIYSTVGIVAAIETSKTPVDTVCMGMAMSGGFWLYLAGRNRYAHEMSTFMYHEVATGIWPEKLEGIKKEVDEMERMQTFYDNYVLKKTSILKSELMDFRNRKAEWFMPADEAKKRGIVTHLLHEEPHIFK